MQALIKTIPALTLRLPETWRVMILDDLDIFNLLGKRVNSRRVNSIFANYLKGIGVIESADLTEMKLREIRAFRIATVLISLPLSAGCR